MHAHVFPVRLVHSHLPLVTSSGFPLTVLYEDRFGWSHRRTTVATTAERALSRVTGAEPFWSLRAGRPGRWCSPTTTGTR